MMSDDIASQFFEALGDYGEEEAIAHFQRSSFSGVSGGDQVPSPRAQEVIDTGEWDAGRKLKLLFVDIELACWGILPEISAVAGGPTYTRFCTSEGCDTSSHKKHKVPMIQRSTGWFLEAGGNARAGAILEISFGVSPDGPIVHSAAPHLVGDNAMKLTHGQWKWLYTEWQTRNVQAYGDDSPMSEDADPYTFEEAAEENKEDIAGQRDAARAATPSPKTRLFPRYLISQLAQRKTFNR